MSVDISMPKLLLRALRKGTSDSSKLKVPSSNSKKQCEQNIANSKSLDVVVVNVSLPMPFSNEIVEVKGSTIFDLFVSLIEKDPKNAYSGPP